MVAVQAKIALRQMMLKCCERYNLIIIKYFSWDWLEICFCLADCKKSFLQAKDASLV